MTSDWVDWFPIVFIPFKIIVLGTAAFFAIKWHHNQDKLKKENEAHERLANAEHTPDASNSSFNSQ
ncbi:hypothetical protein NAC44_18525 [Allorhizobium sp. BGMRC 0089]|uniref:hypothetical protein n=1 Tax=Allorhizobium sonneratiae TaxID=2934936 RepID=UPI002033B2A3|nr:hypothetical protein [Allorhizobium sonneratiae]MCM2294324.1 hypothetical protein [Allorhizobium sonneratiae]